MFFDEAVDGRFLNAGLYHIVSRELYAFGASPDSNACDILYGTVHTSVPTHTEDGIPIRKLYVSNLPPKTTRTELFGVFAQYGFIKSCWLRMGDKGPNRSPMPTYAFVTYSNPADAHKALKAPSHEKILRGRNLRISPADSWHQPAQDDNGRVRWKPGGHRQHDTPSTASAGDPAQPESSSTDNTEVPETSTSQPQPEVPSSSEPAEQIEVPTQIEESYNILDVLNGDCLTHILSYLPITDLIRSERVSKRWQNMVQEYLQGFRTFKTSWWSAAPRSLTTAVLRRVLQRAGPALTRLHIDHHWSTLNDRTAHTVGKFCPNLEELKVVGMHTKNWNPLIYGCKQLKSLSFISCNKLTDSSLIHIVKSDSCIESLTVANNTHVTGLFLTSSNPPKLNSLAFYNCYSLQGTVLCAAIDKLPNLTTLRLDVCPISMWKIIPLILNKLPKLEELSLSEYSTADCLSPPTNAFCKSLSNLTELKVLNLCRNIYITDEVLKQVAQSCTKLESLNISSCNDIKKRKTYPGVGDAGVSAVVSSCRRLARLDVSYLAALSDAGLAAAAALPRLRELTARGNPALSATPLANLLASCPTLQEVDVCGCDGVSEELACAALRAVARCPRPVTLRLAGTPAAHAEDLPSHKLLTLNTEEDLSNPHLRPDFVDRLFDDNSEDSFDDLYDHEDFDNFFVEGHDVFVDDELYMDDDLDDYDGIYALHGDDIILL